MKIETARDFIESLREGPYTSLGGYPKYWVAADGHELSFEACKENCLQIARAIRAGRGGTDIEQWRVIGVEVNWEDPAMYCSHTEERIPSAYAEDRAAPSKQTHWGYGSGMPGCLFDNGPHFVGTKEQAIEGVLFPFHGTGNETDLSEEELAAAKEDLNDGFIHYFPPERRGELGASLVQIWEHHGPCPESDD